MVEDRDGGDRELTPPGSRWRPDGKTPAARGAARRVVEAQHQARTSLGWGSAFVVAAAVAAAFPAGRGWVALHLFLAGGVALAISGSTLLFAITWSAGPAPSRRATTAQRLAIALGAAGVVGGRAIDVPAVLVLAGTTYGAGLIALAVLLVGVVRRAPERRFDASVAWYVAAVVAGLAGAGLGMAVGSGAADGWGGDPRAAHVAVNLLGFVGLTIAGTLPTFAATQLRMRMARRVTPRRLVVLLAWQVASLVLVVGSLLGGRTGLASVGLLAYAAGLIGVVALLPRPAAKQLRWAGPRVAHLVTGWAWFTGGILAAAVAAARGQVVLSTAVIVVMVVCGLGQIVWGSVAYLWPILRSGGGQHLGRGFGATRSWNGVLAANALGLALLAGWDGAALALGALWLGDAAIRVWRAQRIS